MRYSSSSWLFNRCGMSIYCFASVIFFIYIHIKSIQVEHQSQKKRITLGTTQNINAYCRVYIQSSFSNFDKCKAGKMSLLSLYDVYIYIYIFVAKGKPNYSFKESILSELQIYQAVRSKLGNNVGQKLFLVKL